MAGTSRINIFQTTHTRQQQIAARRRLVVRRDNSLTSTVDSQDAGSAERSTTQDGTDCNSVLSQFPREIPHGLGVVPRVQRQEVVDGV